MQERTLETSKPEIGEINRNFYLKGMVSDGEVLLETYKKQLIDGETVEGFLGEHRSVVAVELYEVATGTILLDGVDAEFTTKPFNVTRYYPDATILTSEEARTRGIRQQRRGKRVERFAVVEDRYFFPFRNNDKIVKRPTFQDPTRNSSY